MFPPDSDCDTGLLQDDIFASLDFPSDGSNETENSYWNVLFSDNEAHSTTTNTEKQEQHFNTFTNDQNYGLDTTSSMNSVDPIPYLPNSCSHQLSDSESLHLLESSCALLLQEQNDERPSFSSTNTDINSLIPHLSTSFDRNASWIKSNSCITPRQQAQKFYQTSQSASMKKSLPVTTVSVEHLHSMIFNISPFVGTLSRVVSSVDEGEFRCGTTQVVGKTNDCDQTSVKRSVPMHRKCDEHYLSEYQCLLRKQIEIFEASEEDIRCKRKGRNLVTVGQIGIRCKHCAGIPLSRRPRGSIYYVSTLENMYQAGQKMTKVHFLKGCRGLPHNVQQSLSALKLKRTRASDGKRYWSDAARSLGICETNNGLRFAKGWGDR